MPLDTIEEVLGQRFRVAKPPTAVIPGLGDPIVFSHLRSDEVLAGRTQEVPGEDAYAFQVPLTSRFFGNLWNRTRQTMLPPAQPGSVYLFDFNDPPTVGLDRPFDTLRMYISQRGLDDLAREGDISLIPGLRAQRYGEVDWTLHGLALALKTSLASGTASTLFYQHLAMAFHEHVRERYSHKIHSPPLPRGGLAPWQLSRAQAFIEHHLCRDVSIRQLADETELSASHFSKAFKQSTGISPHQWLIRRRLQKARELLLQGDAPLAHIAVVCGFVDQSHLTRVFTRAEGLTPAVWRRVHKR